MYVYVFDLGGVGEEWVSGGEDWVWALPIMWEQEEGWVCVCVWVAVVWVVYVGSGYGAWTRVWTGGWYYVCVSCKSGYLCRWQVPVSVYCAWRIPAHLSFRCTQCSIMLHILDIRFQTCICLWQISQIQTCLSDLDLSPHHLLL